MPVRLNGSTSGYTELSAPAVAGNNTLLLPTGNGTANQFLKNGSTAGSLGWSSMVEDSSGRLLVGTSSGSGDALLGIQGRQSDSGRGGILQLRRGQAASALSVGDDIGAIRFSDNTSGNTGFAEILCASDAASGANNFPGRLVFSTTASGSASPTERMRITNEGHALVGTTSSLNPANGFSLYYASLNSQLHIGHGNTAPNGNAYVVFSYNSGTIGTIVQNGTTGVTYNTTSDYRLKENVSPISDAVARVQQLKPSRFNFISEPDRTVDGFIAHEAQAVVPECVTGEKDAVDADGKPIYQGIDQSKLVPLLTAALQEALAKIDALESRIAALEVTP